MAVTLPQSIVSFFKAARLNNNSSSAITSTLLVACTILITGFSSNTIGAAEGDAQAQKLEQLRSRIEYLKRTLISTREKRDQELIKLQRVERKIGNIINHIRKINHQQKTESSRLEQLQRQDRQLLADLHKQSSTLDIQIRAAYAMGRQEYLKLLLNQQDPADISRVLTYYRYLSEARADRISSVRSTINELSIVREQIAKRKKELEGIQNIQLETRQTLNQARSEHSQIVATLSRQVRDQSKELADLKKDEKQLESLVFQLQNLMEDVPPPGDLKARFASEKGRLPLPLTGRITARFGAQRQLGDLRWKGLFLANQPGTRVFSVFRGRVAYADWLRGFGLLLIIEHGDGFMTLYGHNQSLYKEVGDWVETNQIIASSGNTGNPPQPGLYFEVRRNGKPLNPLNWCNPRN